MGRPKNWNKKMQQAICQRYEEGESSEKIGKSLGVSGVSIRNILYKNHIQTRDRSEARMIYSLNKTFFDNIDSEEKAYWLGFISADGYINEGRGCFEMAISIKDKNHLSKFMKSINSSSPIREYKYDYSQFAKIRIGNQYFSTSLLKFFDSKKTTSLRFPQIDVSLVNHFIRGYFDGDGSVSNGKNPQMSITSNIEFIKQIQEIFIHSIGLNKTKFYVRRKENPNIN
jgi:intein-encoded DNA endonuclease-like protein